MGRASFILFRTGSHCVAQADFELATLKFETLWEFVILCFNLPIAGIMSVCHHSYVLLFFTAIEEIKPKVLCMLGKDSMTDYIPGLHVYIFKESNWEAKS